MNLKERKAIIAGNWKLNKRVSEIPAFTQELQANLPAERCCDVVICAPYPLIAALETAGQGCHLGVGAQEPSGHNVGCVKGTRVRYWCCDPDNFLGLDIHFENRCWARGIRYPISVSARGRAVKILFVGI